jgi:hypothetical protein
MAVPNIKNTIVPKNYYYFPVIEKENFDGVTVKNPSRHGHIPLTFLKINCPNSHVSATEFYAASASKHPDIYSFLSVSGSLVSPPENGGMFAYLSANYPGSAIETTVTCAVTLADNTTSNVSLRESYFRLQSPIPGRSTKFKNPSVLLGGDPMYPALALVGGSPGTGPLSEDTGTLEIPIECVQAMKCMNMVKFTLNGSVDYKQNSYTYSIFIENSTIKECEMTATRDLNSRGRLRDSGYGYSICPLTVDNIKNSLGTETTSNETASTGEVTSKDISARNTGSRGGEGSYSTGARKSEDSKIVHFSANFSLFQVSQSDPIPVTGCDAICESLVNGNSLSYNILTEINRRVKSINKSVENGVTETDERTSSDFKDDGTIDYTLSGLENDMQGDLDDFFNDELATGYPSSNSSFENSLGLLKSRFVAGSIAHAAISLDEMMLDGCDACGEPPIDSSFCSC